MMRFWLALTICFSFAVAPAAESFTGEVVGISDGDTIRAMHDGKAEWVRLWGIDCPESGQPFGTRAKQFTGDLAFCETVTVQLRDVDRYWRIVAEVKLPDGRTLNREIVRAGFARWYARCAKHDTALRDLENEARAARAVGRSAADPTVRVAAGARGVPSLGRMLRSRPGRI